MDLELRDKVVVITGANSGIGLATARAFAAEGARVVGVDISVGALTEAGIEAVATDLLREGAVEEFVEGVVSTHSTVDVLVNNVGIAPFRDGFLSTSVADWRQLFELNVLVAVRANQAVLPVMVRNAGGALVHLASDVGRQPDPFFVDYAVTKLALMSISKSLSIEFGRHGVRSNCVAPGPTRTPAMSEFLERLAADHGIDPADAPTYFARDMRQLPLGRMNEPEDVSRAILFLSSSASRQVTGSVYSVDAGALRYV
jgi:NAD(P)-dependent dehydrogenase (short-subunit alcohol dehydrogenase family)